MAKVPAIGIDLGTTYSCVGVVKRGKVEIIVNDQGNRVTPSCVSFTDIEIAVGEGAKVKIAQNPENTILEVKRLIGRRFEDETVQEDMKRWPFTVISDDGKPKIQVQYEGKTTTFFPEEISAKVLIKMKEAAEAYLGNTVTSAVITVPAYFNDNQKQATKDAAEIAGLKVLQMLNEPLAAAISYGLDKKGRGKKTVLIFDLGGGTCDVAILTIEDGKIDVQAKGGDTHLGGDDFDTKMVEHFFHEFQSKHKKDLATDKRAVAILRNKCEEAKRLLSSNYEASIEIDNLFESINFYTSITRAKFEDLNEDLFHKAMGCIQKCFENAGMDKAQIDEIVLVGGSTRIPKVQKLLQEYFNGKPLNKSINPDEGVAYGAAIQASILNGDLCEQFNGLVLRDVTPLSLGIELVGGMMSVIIKRNTRIPASHTEEYTTYKDNQTSVDIPVYEGERLMAKDNYLLGKFTLTGIPPAPHGDPQIDVKFDIDTNGILNVTAFENAGGESNNITITHNKGRLSKEEIRRLLKDAEYHRAADEKEKQRVLAKNALETYCYDMQKAVEDVKLKGRISEDVKKTILDKCNEVICWLDDNRDASKEEFEIQKKELESVCNQI